jgi:hypothetical protein
MSTAKSSGTTLRHSRLTDFATTWSIGVVERLSLEICLAMLVAVAAMLMATVWAMAIPFNHAPDEVDHFQLSTYVAEHASLPIYDVSPGIRHTTCFSRQGPCVGSYASAPPGAVLLSALPMALQHKLTGEPYGGLLLAARVTSALCIGVYVSFLYLISRALVADTFTRLTGVAIGAFIPQVTFIGSYTNDDAFSLAAGSMVLYASVTLLRGGLTLRKGALVGLSVGLLALSKLNYYPLFVVFSLAAVARLALEVRQGRARRYLGSLGLAMGVVAVGSGWWYVRGFVLYGDPFGTATLYRNFYRVAPAYRLHTLMGQGMSFPDMLREMPWVSWSFESFWGRFDYMSLLLPDAIYGVLAVFCTVCLAGLCMAGGWYVLSHRGVAASDREQALVWLVAVGVVLSTIVLSAWTSYTNDFQAQGRYLFPALVPMVLLLSIGLHAWSTQRGYRVGALSVMTMAMLALNIYSLVGVIVPTYHHWIR